MTMRIKDKDFDLKEIFNGGFKEASQATVVPDGQDDSVDLQSQGHKFGHLTGAQSHHANPFGAKVFAKFHDVIDTIEGVPDLVLKHEAQGLQLGAGLFDLMRDLAHQKTPSKP